MSTAAEIYAVREHYEHRLNALADLVDEATRRWVTQPMLERMIMRQPVQLPRVVSRKRARHWRRQIRKSWLGLKIEVRMPKLFP